MKLNDSSPDRFTCPVCHNALATGAHYCSACGTTRAEGLAEELRALLYLLSELRRWQAEGSLNAAQADSLRERYERRRDELRVHLASTAKPSAQHIEPALEIEPTGATAPGAAQARQTSSRPAQTAPSTESSLPPSTQPRAPFSETTQTERRHLLETLTEPYTLRLLLYTGAGMFVVGIIIWLRDVLYLKLQEPLVQAALLATGTLLVLASGWYTILRTRQRLTGRALTLAGSLLFPVNFWFLVRSGLISSSGRAWVVCALSALLYALTAALLNEKLYVYMACVATLSTGWALVYSNAPDAPALYALVLTFSALAFLHLSRLFIATVSETQRGVGGSGIEATDVKPDYSSDFASGKARLNHALWSGPLVHVALAGAYISALLYMTLRVGVSPSLYESAFRLTSRNYDSGVSITLFACLAYTAWFAGRYIYERRRALLYTLGLLSFFWMEFLIFDGLRLSGSLQLLLLATSALIVSVAARLVELDWLRRAFYVSSVFASVMLTPVALMMLAAEAATLMHSIGFATLAVAFAVLSATRLSERAAQRAFSYLSALLATVAFLVALASASLTNTTLITAVCAAWPFALYACAWLAEARLKEPQLVKPFVLTSSAEVTLLLMWASAVALILYLSESWLILPRAALVCALAAVILYGITLIRRERSPFGASLASLAAVVLVASSLDALQDRGLWPRSWPIAAGVVCAAFALDKAGAWLMLRGRTSADEGGPSPASSTRIVLDGATLVSALLWLVTALFLFNQVGFGAAAVLLLSLAYWMERAASERASLPVHVADVHAGALLFALLAAFGVERQWLSIWFVVALVPLFYGAHLSARSRSLEWLARPLQMAAPVTLAFAFVASILEATQNLRAGDSRLLAPAITVGAIALVSFILSLLSNGRRRVRYFRAGLYASVTAYALFCLRAGFEPLVDVEVYTSPIAVLLLVVAYMAYRRDWDEYASDTSRLFWSGSILLCAPLLLRALEFRLLFAVPAPTRDLATLCAGLALLIFGITGRLRAPVIVGVGTLLIELASLTLTSVDWLQVPLKIYLVTVGALLALVGWMFEYRREQLMLIRARFNERRATARERFNAWR